MLQLCFLAVLKVQAMFTPVFIPDKHTRVLIIHLNATSKNVIFFFFFTNLWRIYIPMKMPGTLRKLLHVQSVISVNGYYISVL